MRILLVQRVEEKKLIAGPTTPVHQFLQITIDSDCPAWVGNGFPLIIRI
jgi:hypothetical protein